MPSIRWCSLLSMAMITSSILCLEMISHFSGEQEIIFPPNACFKLVNKDENVKYHHTDTNFVSKIKTRYEFEYKPQTQSNDC